MSQFQFDALTTAMSRAIERSQFGYADHNLTEIAQSSLKRFRTWSRHVRPSGIKVELLLRFFQKDVDIVYRFLAVIAGYRFQHALQQLFR